MRYLLIIGLLFNVAFGQSLFGVVAGDGATDIYNAVYSVRKVNSRYTGNCLRVRRSSDNTEQDIGFTSNGDLDTASMKTFVSTNSGFVVTWYDQSGSSRNATQSTQANQPRIINAGVVDRINGKVAIVFDGSNDFLEAASTTGISILNTSLVSVSTISSLSNTIRTVFANGILAATVGLGHAYSDNTNFAAQDRLVSNIRPTAGTNNTAGLTIAARSTNTFSLAFSIYNSTNNNIWVNSSNSETQTITLSNVTNSQNISIGVRLAAPSATTFYHNGTISEIIFYKRDMTGRRASIESNINSYYSIY